MDPSIAAAGGGAAQSGEASPCETKLCKKCNVVKPLNDMVKKDGSYRPTCKECRNSEARERLKNDPELREKERLRGKSKYQNRKEKHLAITKKYYEENLEWRKDLHLRNTYGITMDDKIAMRESQRNCCAICTEEFPDDKSAYVDHCHTTKKVRGLLCHKCNTGIGMFRDNLEFIRRAGEYLLKNSA